MRTAYDPYATAPKDYRHPSDRTSFFDRPVPAHLQPVPIVSTDFPRHVHQLDQDAEGKAVVLVKVVHDALGLEAALACGWSTDPLPVPPPPE